MRSSKLLKLGGLGLGGAAIVGSCSTDSTPYAVEEQQLESKRPNILFIFSDDHAIKSISAYGDSLNKTPNIDRVAEEGVLFRNNFCANSISAPSRACVLTGKHSHANGQMTNYTTFDGSQQTFPKILQQSGYKTALIGKWHLKSDPMGFDKWMVYPGQGNYYNPTYIIPGEDGKRTRTSIEGYSVDVTTNLSMEWMRKQKESETPFLMMCQFKAPHRVWAPAPRYLNLYDDVTFPIPDSFYDDFKNRNSAMPNHRMGIKEHMYMGYDLKAPKPKNGKPGKSFEEHRMTAAQAATWNAAYGPKNRAVLAGELTGRELDAWKYQRYVKDYLRCVAAVDENIGRLLAFLKEEGLDENTIVIYSSDQGFYLGEHGWFDKRWMYEESLRMPLVMKWPSRIAAGQKVTALTQNIDFAPTLLDACGISVPEAMHGESMLPLVDGTGGAWRESIYYHYYESPSEHGVPFHYGVRTDRYKLIHYYEIDEWELFDLQADPNEMKSVYDSPEYAEIQKDMHRELTKVRAKYNSVYGKENPDPQLKRRLEGSKKRRAKIEAIRTSTEHGKYVGEWKSGKIGSKTPATSKFDITGFVDGNGEYEVTFLYTSGSYRLDIHGVKLMRNSDELLAEDKHFGYTGSGAKDNVYKLKVTNFETGSPLTVCADICGDLGNNSNGFVFIRKVKSYE